MDDNQTQEQAPDEVLVSEANTSEAEAEDNTEAEAEKGDEGTADDADADSSDDDESEDEDEQPRRKKKSGLDRIKRQLETLKAENQILRSRQPQQADSGDLDSLIRTRLGEPPQEAKFTNFLDFERANTAYETAKLILKPQIEAELASQERTQRARQEEALEAYNERIAEADKKIPGLAATIAKVNVNIRSDIVPHIIESDKSALIAHYLSQNPKKAAELNSLPEKQAIKEIGRLEARLSFPKTQTATSAPSPVRPPKGGAGVVSPSQEIEAYIRRTYGKR